MGKAKGSARRKKNIIEDDGANAGRKKVEKKEAKRQRQSQQPQQMLRSKFVGVSWRKKQLKWKSEIRINGKLIHLGYYPFEEEKEAALLYDEHAALVGKAMNFPLHEGQEQAVKPLPRRMDRSTLPNVNRPSKYRGVSWHKLHKKWTANITTGYKTKNLGLFVDEKEAARIYDEQAILLGKPVNFPLHEGMEQAVKQVPKGTAKRYKKVRRGKDDKAADDKAKEEDDDEGLSDMEEGTNDDDDDNSRWC